MILTQYQVDAFASRVFKGNPAAICPLTQWLTNELMLDIAAENNLSETAFFVPNHNGFDLRWFTPVNEIDLCGHATLAAAHVIFERLEFDQLLIRFATRSGELTVAKHGDLLQMNFPALPSRRIDTPTLLRDALGVAPSEVWVADDYMAVFDREQTIRELAPDMSLLRRLDRRGVIVTARGEEADFVSRFFGPKCGIDEDPVTGSAHCQMLPYWVERLGRQRLQAMQISRRGGELECELQGERVLLSGQAVIFLEGQIHIPE